MTRDQIYANDEAPAGSFEFTAAVAEVFPDMLRRSIPGYAETIEAIGALASRFVTPSSHCYDLGCSLGAATLAMQQHSAVEDFEIFAVDTAPAMVERCRALLGDAAGPGKITVLQQDIRKLEISNASMVVMNYTLQFLPVDERLAMVRRIHDGMNRGGILVLSEKVADKDADIERLLVDLHHGFKRANAYSDLEISRKRTALENVLIPETIETHLQRIADAGFAHAGVWLRHFNFASIVAIR